ncbi:MAG: Acylphosphatase [uncultured bacterium]|nr:MAG: Acylphosphatase [uncultured bacterium]
METLKIIVRGKVQGVGFRYATKKRAEELNLKCEAKNLENGDVFINAVGKEENLQKLVDWCKKGNGLAVVENIRIFKG